LRKERVHTQDEVRETEYQVKEWRQKQKWTAEKAHKEEVQSNRLDVELEHVITLLREEYELSYELAKEQYSLPADYEKAKREVSALKTSIDQLGNVHLDAIEEYDRLVERHDFLQGQEQDLLQAKDTLCQVIEEMDSEMTKRFQDTFEQVRRHFLGVFQELFGGGRADLVLSDPDDMLATGVDIVAQPPGKKLQHLGLLSGGERALTAIALLFAILKVRPVPFCVLDEVEAALDEANVSRFAQYLTEFSTETQFIVITHRKGTMEEADVLYGITMQESGVSNIVSVKMEETDEMVSV
jgi:chromosome segregation protein